MHSAMRLALNSATHGRRLKLHQVPGFGEVSKVAGQPQPPEMSTICAGGTDVALRYLDLGVPVLSTSKAGRRGGARNSAVRATVELTAAQSDNLIAAACYATEIGLPLTRMITIHWQSSGVPLQLMAATTGRFIDLLTKALARHGSKTAWLWVHENGNRKGGHCHLLVHVRTVHVPVIMHLQVGWLRRITGQPYRRRVIKSDPIGRKLGLETKNPELWTENADKTLGYILKGIDPNAPLAASLPRLEPGGRVIGKRCGTSQNIGRKARSERTEA